MRKRIPAWPQRMSIPQLSSRKQDDEPDIITKSYADMQLLSGQVSPISLTLKTSFATMRVYSSTGKMRILKILQEVL